MSEEATGKLCAAATLTGLVASVGVLALMLLHDARRERGQRGEAARLPRVARVRAERDVSFERLDDDLVVLGIA